MLNSYPETAIGIEAAEITIGIARQGWSEVVSQKETFGLAVWNLQGFAQGKLIGTLPQDAEVPSEFYDAKKALFDLAVSPQLEGPEAIPIWLDILIKMALRILERWLEKR